MNTKLITPTRLRQYTKIEQTPLRSPCFLVYYDGGLTSLSALRTACANATPETEIVVVYLEMVPLSQEPVRKVTNANMAAQAILAAANVNAAMYGRVIATLGMECHARGPALLQLAAQHSNATIYLGTDCDETDPFADYVQALEPSRVVLVSV